MPAKAGKAKAKGRPKMAAIPEAPHPMVDDSVNADVWKRHAENCTLVLQHPLFQDAQSHDPLALSSQGGAATGYQAPFNMQQACAALKEHGTYLCSINVAWLSDLFSATPNVPLSWSSIEDCHTNYFPKPAGFSKVPLHVAVTKAEMEEKNFGAKGSWRRVSADEPFVAWRKALSEDIQSQKSDSVLQMWFNHMLTSPAVFHVVDTTDELSWVAENIREDFSSAQTLVRTTVQRIFHVNNERVSMGNPPVTEMHERFDKKLKTSTNSEEISLWFIKGCYEIWDKALKNERIRNIILAEEAHRKESMFNTMSKLWVIVQKAQTEEYIEFSVMLVHDYHNAGIYTTADLKAAALEGRLPDSNGKGLVDVWIFKKKLLAYLTGELLSEKDLPPRIKEQIREVTKDFTTFRERVGYKKSLKLPDLSWKAGWPASGDAMLTIIEDHSLSKNNNKSVKQTTATTITTRINRIAS